ncbi:nuclear transport factor 2 family protein [Massilia sp. DJPM01]|uniref:nuclear transport factor 2 family protein n=1 Tax=Massilia sp. DJPM01 TaxID=3024404 RepID=UPI00259F84CC|nr:nuclear transport factor 2 family protein [Massilia sp. DJPM01]MDM5180265.1 nuclear transport factor 2 family protein [Massilia sp. DJPM01]
MNPLRFLSTVFGACLILCVPGRASADVQLPTETEQIASTLTAYMEGTANGEPAKLRNVFHPDFKLYTVNDANQLLIRSGEQYIANITPGKKINRIGRILSIDVENNAAAAKVEILMPDYRLYSDYFMLLKYQGSWKIVHKSYTWKNVDKQSNKILFVTSNQHTYGSTRLNTANHFEEIAIAYDVFKRSGFQVDFVSPSGGAIPLEYIKTSDKTQKEYLYNAAFMTLLQNTFKPEQIDANEYKAVYYSGGGSAMFGVAENKGIQNIASRIYENGGIISAVCHGTAGITLLKDRNGKSVFLNKKVTGFSDIFEDTQADYYKTFPFSIDKEIGKHGGNFVHSKKLGEEFYVVDGNIITGQDPSATASVAHQVINTIRKN